jgi:hypothetical protein
MADILLPVKDSSLPTCDNDAKPPTTRTIDDEQHLHLHVVRIQEDNTDSLSNNNSL